VQIFNASDSFSPDDNRQLAVFAKPENSKQFLRNAISAHYLFESLGDDDLNRIIDCMRPTFAAVDEVVIRQGELGDLFFCLETGAATASVDGKAVMNYEPGGCFGELALIYNSPRAASVVATSACKLWTLDLRYVPLRHNFRRVGPNFFPCPSFPEPSAIFWLPRRPRRW
jgi:CRP-like cAMP-binding protein